MCLVCEIKSVTEHLSITKQFVTLGPKWGDSQVVGSKGAIVSYSFATENFTEQFGFFDSFIPEGPFQREITTSFSAWENVADIRFELVSDSSNVDIRFGWRDIDGNSGVLGETTIPSSGPLDGVVVALDVNEDWFLSVVAAANQIDFSSTVTHEIGHAIGIDHSEVEQALMNASYSSTIFNIQRDDIDAAIAVYGSNDVQRTDVYRFYNPTTGGHFFTADVSEKIVVEENNSFLAEGTGFEAMFRADTEISGSVPIYRFFNSELGSHFFTASELEKDHVGILDGFIYEGVGFRAFNENTSSTIPIHRFFNQDSGGHFFTASQNEKDAVMDIPQFNYEGEAFYAFADQNI
jgi:hypothetical protein